MSKMKPPPQAPRNEPSWWLKKAMPVRVVRYLTPKMSSTKPLTSGITDSHSIPITAAKINEWNNTKRYARAVIDANGDPSLRYDANLSPARTYEGFADDFSIFRGFLSDFKTFIGF